MNPVMVGQIRNELQQLFQGCGEIDVAEQLKIHAPTGPYDEWRVTYDQLAKAAARFGTTKINFEYDKGWLGTHETPGTPSRCSIVIDDWTFTAQFHA